MPIWVDLLDAAGLVVLLLLLYGVLLVVRRRVLSRHGGTFELSYRVRAGQPGPGWLLGLGRYSGDRLEWFRIFSLSPRPKRVWQRARLTYVERRDPEGVEQLSLYPGHVVIRCETPQGDVELALSRASLMGFQSWLEAAPPGTDWSRDSSSVSCSRLATRSLLAFVLNGFCFATLVSRVPDLQGRLDLTTASFGLLLLSSAVGAVLALPSAGFLIDRASAGAVVRLGVVIAGAGLFVAAVGRRPAPGRRGPGRPVLLRVRHRHLGRRDERRGGRGRAAAGPQHHAALPRRLVTGRRSPAPRSAFPWPPSRSRSRSTSGC